MVFASTVHNIVEDKNEKKSETIVKTTTHSSIIYILELFIIFVSFYFYFLRNFSPECTNVSIFQQIVEFFLACCCHVFYIAYSLVVGGCTGGPIMKGGFRRRR